MECLYHRCEAACADDKRLLSSFGTKECFPVSSATRVRSAKIRLRRLCGSSDVLASLLDAETCVDVRDSFDIFEDRFIAEQSTVCGTLLSSFNDMDETSVLGADGGDMTPRVPLPRGITAMVVCRSSV